MDQYPDISPSELERIERYLTGQMDAPEKEGFESELAAQPVLRAQTGEVKLLITGIREVSVAEKMKQFHDEMNSTEKTVPRIGGMKRWLVAASVIAVVGIGMWFALGRNSREDNTYLAYYEKDPGLLSAMGSTSDNYDFDRAMIDYKNGNNPAAIKTWETQVKQSPANDTLNYFLGSAYLAEGNTSKALEYFNQVIRKGESSFLQDAYWYSALAFIKEGKNKEARPLLEKSDRKEKDELLKAIND
ncbi:MAG: tetratricopeptide repeat protein [Chitinophagaceae bacterium]|nr:MAG: tetratricopeptide repeat protein [Chitinophagaceae bacterium]